MLLKLGFIGTYKLRVLFAIEIKIELRDWCDVVRLCCISCFISLNSTEDYVWVFIFFCKSFESWFESHAGSTPRSPKINNNNCIFVYNFLQMSLALDCKYRP